MDIDKVAKAIWEADGSPGMSWDAMTIPYLQQRYRILARAAVDSLKLTQFWSVDLGPGEGMSEEVHEHWDAARDVAAEDRSAGYTTAKVVTAWSTDWQDAETPVSAPS